MGIVHDHPDVSAIPHRLQSSHHWLQRLSRCQRLRKVDAQRQHSGQGRTDIESIKATTQHRLQATVAPGRVKLEYKRYRLNDFNLDGRIGAASRHTQASRLPDISMGDDRLIVCVVDATGRRKLPE